MSVIELGRGDNSITHEFIEHEEQNIVNIDNHNPHSSSPHEVNDNQYHEEDNRENSSQKLEDDDDNDEKEELTAKHLEDKYKVVEEEESEEYEQDEEAQQEELEKAQEMLSEAEHHNYLSNNVLSNIQESLSIDDLSDRAKLLYHITYLNTQLQRLHLQNNELKRSLTLVLGMIRQNSHSCALHHNLSPHKKQDLQEEEEEEEEEHVEMERGEKKEQDDSCSIKISSTALTACLIASHDERSLEYELQQSLIKFDPHIAQSHIYKLDSTIAQLSMLRHVEVERLMKCEEELCALRESHDRVMEELEQTQIAKSEFEHSYNVEHDACRALQIEVEQLRQTERQLLSRLQELESFRGIRSEKTYNHAEVIADQNNNENVNRVKEIEMKNIVLSCRKLEFNEMCERQAILQEMFWSPLCIAFDAGLTWMSEVDKLHEMENVHDENRVSSIDNKSKMDNLTIPITVTDSVAVERHEEEMNALRNELAACQANLVAAELNIIRYQSLYASEQVKSKTLEGEFRKQMERILQEVEHDRQVILSVLQEQLQHSKKIQPESSSS